MCIVHWTSLSCKFGISRFDRSTWVKGALYLIKHFFVLFPIQIMLSFKSLIVSLTYVDSNYAVTEISYTYADEHF
jgi:hypothetical protein